MTTKAEMSRTTALFNVYAEAYEIDAQEFLHEARQAELAKHGITESSKPVLKKLSELRQENKKLKERKGDNDDKQNNHPHN